ncbi:MAG: hypothetical protein HKN91_05650, partial [Acidimicrobiia bacterium]|nr:hypothetical protein [Acidimicrobiia bacterium]
MVTELRIRFETVVGQAVQVLVGGVVLDLAWLGDGWWGVDVELDLGDEYRYRVVAEDGVVNEEPMPPRVIGRLAPLILDRWRWSSGRPFGSALFTKALALRHVERGDVGEGSATFVLTEPAVPAGSVPAIVGSTTALGEWDATSAIRMVSTGYPGWAVSLDLEPDELEYKYVLVDAEGTLLQWEGGDNRVLPAGTTRIVNDDRMAVPAFRAAGVAVPVFSIRTDQAIGCGQFTDLKPFADWTKSVGMALVQLLPVNDTVLDHDWDDSYPYNPISVHALHPLYVDMEAIPDHGIHEQIMSARDVYAGAAEIDYPAVMATKWNLLRAAYSNLGDGLDGDADFEEFVDDHWTWLGPYSAWSLLRDR